MLPLWLLCRLPWGCLGVAAKLIGVKNCSGLSDLDDRLMTYILLEIEEATGLLLVGMEAIVVVVDVVDGVVWVVETHFSR